MSKDQQIRAALSKCLALMAIHDTDDVDWKLAIERGREALAPLPVHYVGSPLTEKRVGNIAEITRANAEDGERPAAIFQDGKGNGLPAFFGKWPGNETDADMCRILQEHKEFAR